MTGTDLLREVRDILKDADIENARFDSAQIVSKALNMTVSQVMTDYDEISDKEYESAIEMANKRAKRYPLQYILGNWEFYSLPFIVGEGVLIPRPETETLVDCALDYIADSKDIKVIDLCSGSGCIAISIDKNTENAKIEAIEKSKEAFEYLEENIKLNRSDVNAINEDIFEYSPTEGEYDLIVSNPPYISFETMKTLETELTFEPYVALCGGDDGLDFYRLIASKYIKCLKPGGAIMLEIGFDQKHAVTEILAAAGVVGIECMQDVSGLDRVIVGTMPL